MKVYDFPLASRTERGILTENSIKDYYKKKKSKKGSALEKYASFNGLIYLAKKLDVETAQTLGGQIYDETLDLEVIEAYIDSIIGYN